MRILGTPMTRLRWLALALLGGSSHVLAMPADDDGPLHAAALEASMEWAKKAIEDGANLNERDSLGYTPLHRVADDGLPEVATLFLKHGADTEARDHNEATPLLLAAGSGHVVMLETLRTNGARLDALDEFGLGCLHYAAESGHIEAVRWLLAHGANADLEDEAGKTPGQLARAWGFPELAALLDDASSTPSHHIETRSEPTLPEGAMPLFPAHPAGTASKAEDDAGPSSTQDGPGLGPRRMRMPTQLQPEKLEL